MNSIIPQALDAEIAVISAVLTDSARALDEGRHLKEKHFSSLAHKAIWKAARAVLDAGGHPDLVTVTTWLQGANALECVGGHHGISKLAMAFPTSAHTSHYAKIIIDKWKLRQLLGLADQIQERIKSDSVSNLVSEIETQLFSLSHEKDDENQLELGVNEFLEQIQVRQAGGEIGVQTKIRVWDKAFGGILPGRYYVLGGRPSMGKTAMAEQIALQLLVLGKGVLFVSKEMRRERLVGRLCSKIAKVNYERFLKGYAGNEEYEKLSSAANVLKKTNLHLVNPSEMSGGDVRALMRRLKNRQSVDMVVIDYVQLLNGEKGQTQFETVARNSNEIRTAANETGLPVLALVQLNRESERDGRPSMRHIKDASQIEQDADCISLLWSDEDRESDTYDPSKRIFTVEKNRDGPSAYDEKLGFDGPLMSFYDQK